MRQIIFLAAAFAMGLAGPANAAWQKYENDTFDYSVMFPAEPSEGTGFYRSDLVPNAPTHFTKLEDGESTFIALVIQTGRPEEGAVLMGEIEYWLGHIGDIVLNTISRLNIGMEYGRFLSIDCRDDVVPEAASQAVRARYIFDVAAGLKCPNGARLTVNMFFNQGRLYVAAGMQEGTNAKRSGAPGRFANSLGWIGANAERAETLVDWDARIRPEDDEEQE